MTCTLLRFLLPKSFTLEKILLMSLLIVLLNFIRNRVTEKPLMFMVHETNYHSTCLLGEGSKIFTSTEKGCKKENSSSGFPGLLHLENLYFRIFIVVTRVMPQA